MNCACHGQTSLNDLVRELNRILGTSIQPEYAPEREGDVKHSFAAIDRMVSVLGYRPGITFGEGLDRTCAYYRSAILGASLPH
jgi:nucleoside-diphosphate-sugar epimerase